MAGKILLIEDEPGIADNVSYALATEGFEPVWRATGREGLAEIGKGGVQLVILDVMLPDMDGFAVCREIRRGSDLPVIFLTARADGTDRVVGLEIGGDDYVVKPFSPRELVARVKAVLRRSPGERRPAAKPAAGRKPPPFTIDEERLVISYFGKKLALSRYEFRILKVLVERPGWVYSREKLMSMCWEDPAASMERTVDAHVKSIRAKLHAVTPGREAINTHRGLGYSLAEDW